MDTMLSLRVAIPSLLLLLTVGSESSIIVSPTVSHSKSKRDLDSYSYATLGPPLLRPPKTSYGVVSGFTKDDFESPTNSQKVTFKTVAKNATKFKEHKVSSNQVRPLGLNFNPNISMQQTEVPSLSGRSATFPSNQMSSEIYVTSLGVNPKSRVSGDPKLKHSTHLYPYSQKQMLSLDSLSGYPIFSRFYGEPLLPVASQTIKNPIYRVRHLEPTGTKTESESYTPTYRTNYPAGPTKVIAYSPFPFSRDFAGLDKQRALTAATNAKLQAKTPYFDFPIYDLPNVGNADAYGVQQNAALQGQHIIHQSTPLNSRYKAASTIRPTSNKHITKGHLEPYQALADQPQLHFSNLDVWQPVMKTQFFKPLDNIRTDVEIVDKKKPAPPKPSPPDDYSGEDENSDEDEKNDDDDGYKFTAKDFGLSSADEDNYSEKFAKKKEGEKSYRKPFGFQVYDEKFGKYSKKKSVANNKEQKPTPDTLMGFNFNSDTDEDSDEYLSKFYGDYSPKQDYEDKSAEETKVNERQESDEDDDYRAMAQPMHENYEEEFDKNYRPLNTKKNTSKKSKKGKVMEISSKVAQLPRNYEEKPNWFQSDEFNDQPDTKNQASISYKRNVEFKGDDVNKNNVSELINGDAFGYKFPKPKSTLKSINHYADMGIHTNLQSPVAQGFRVNPSFHKSNIPGNENGPPQETRNSYSVSAENKWLLNKRSQDKRDNRNGAHLKAVSDVYNPSNPSFLVTKEHDYLTSLAGI